MPRVLKRPQAEADLDDLWWYIAQDNPEAADRLLERIEELCELLATRPQLGRRREELAPGLRSFPAESYAIFYQPITDGIAVVRVLHASRDIDRLF